MSLSKYFILNFLLIFICVPWIFHDISNYEVINIPLWAFYTVVATLIYAIVIAILLHFYWNEISSIES